MSEERSSPKPPESRLSSFREITSLDIIPETEDEVEEYDTVKEEAVPQEARSQTRISSASTIVSHPEDILLPEVSQAREYINEIDRESVMVSEEEIQEWDRQMDEQKELMKKYSEDFQQWEDKMTQRKLIAFGRLKNLNRCHKKRMDFYEIFKDYVKQAEVKLKNKTDTEKSFTETGKKKDIV